MAPTKKGGNMKGYSAINEVVTQEHTINIQKTWSGLHKAFPSTPKEIWKSAMKEMGIPDMYMIPKE